MGVAGVTRRRFQQLYGLLTFVTLIVMYYYTTLGIAAGAAFCSSSSNENGNGNGKKVGLFVFGDSLYDSGNNNYINTTTEFQANFWPYGESFFCTCPSGRFSDGRIIPDFICEYAKLPIPAPYLQPGNHEYVYGANFASAGAGALEETYQGRVVSLKTQLSYFKKVAKELKQQLGDKQAVELLSNSVYLFSVGGNDHYSPARPHTFQSYSHQEFINMVIANFTSVIREIYNEGGRKFGFLKLPPLGCWPSAKAKRSTKQKQMISNTTTGGGGGGGGNPCDPDIDALVEQHTQTLTQSIYKLEKQLQGFVYTYFDLHTVFKDIMTNPSKYGFKNGESACCGSGPYRGFPTCGGIGKSKEYKLCKNPREYLFFDSYHPNEVAYQQLAKQMWNGSPKITGPYNLKSLFQLSPPPSCDNVEYV